MRAREQLTLPDEVGLALRAHRFAVRMSQRSYARSRGMSRSLLARLEAGESSTSLATVMEALDGTGFALFVGLAEDPSEPPPGAAAALAAPHPDCEGGAMSWVPEPISPAAWRETELLARVRGGGRRFPAHRRTLYVENSPPLWWWMHEFFVDPSNPPLWYAPMLDPDEGRPPSRPRTAPGHAVAPEVGDTSSESDADGPPGPQSDTAA